MMNSPFGFGLPKFQISLFFLFMAFLFLHSVLALTNPKPLCDVVFQCGNLTVGFPFWGDKRPEICGHSDLELRCDNQTTSLQIQDVSYTLLHYNNTTQTLKLTRLYNLGISLCSLPISNTTLDSGILESLPGYKNLTVYYACNVSSSNDPYSFICPDGETGLISTASEGKRSCATNTTFLVPEDFDDANAKNILLRFKRVLKEGFEVKLKSDDKACRDCVSSGGFCSFVDGNQICGGCNNSTGNSTNCRSSPPPPDQVFGLIQNTNNSVCGDCERSDGVCAYDGRSNRFICYCADGSYELTCGSSKKVSLLSGKPFWRTKYVIGSTASLAGFISISFAFICYKLRKSKKATKRDLNSENVEALIAHKRYTYPQVKKMTKSFAHIVGKGGFGVVYRGKLPDGRLVAVKVLTDTENTGEEFINEVASMSKTSHVNIVSLHGFCFERSKRAIIYEFVVNGSLDKFISDKGSLQLDRKTFYDIALGVARGLEYLHNGCNTRIVHFDIKPQNILLDEEFCPKISDFGLAKLHEKKQSMISLLDARGTYGYIAPEVFSKTYGKPSHKSDVYSFGMLLLEMVGARNKEAVEPSVSNCSSEYFPDWIYKDLERRETARLAGDEINEEQEKIVRKMTLVGLWCIQSSPLDRPPMSKVVEMMEGSIDTLQIPPKPILICPAAAPLENCPCSAEESSFSEKSQVAQASSRSLGIDVIQV